MVENQQLYKILFFISIFVLVISNSLLIYKNSANLKNIKNQGNICPAVECPIAVPLVPVPTIIPSTDMTCGGISGAMCPTGYNCHLNGNYPDASGICIKATTKKDPSTYTCPVNEWVDCMPSVDEPQSYQCETAFLTWARAHCPGFKGAAL